MLQLLDLGAIVDSEVQRATKAAADDGGAEADEFNPIDLYGYDPMALAGGEPDGGR